MTRRDNHEFRLWAAEVGLSVAHLPPHLRGERDSYGVRLGGGLGWLWDASPAVGVEIIGSYRRRNPILAAMLALGLRLRMHCDDATLGYVSREAWGPAWVALLKPRQKRQMRPKEAR